MSAPSSASDPPTGSGFLFAFSAYGLWGFMPLYFNAVSHVPAVEVLVHRIIWSVPVVLVVIAGQRRLGELGALFRNRRILGLMTVTALLITVNWGLYIWAISMNITSEAALGYYINPLITVVLGYALLQEKLTRLQVFAVMVAAIGVLVRTIAGGVFPWIALTLAVSFAAYGYLRKTVPVGPTQRFLMEVIVLAPVALAYAIWLWLNGSTHFTFSNSDGPWLMLAGPVTAVPLILYAFGAKLLPLTTLGLMQYIAPTLILLISFLVFEETMDIWQGITFIMIWVALVLYTWSIYAQSKGI